MERSGKRASAVSSDRQPQSDKHMQKSPGIALHATNPMTCGGADTGSMMDNALYNSAKLAQFNESQNMSVPVPVFESLYDQSKNKGNQEPPSNGQTRITN